MDCKQIEHHNSHYFYRHAILNKFKHNFKMINVLLKNFTSFNMVWLNRAEYCLHLGSFFKPSSLDVFAWTKQKGQNYLFNPWPAIQWGNENEFIKKPVKCESKSRTKFSVLYLQKLKFFVWNSVFILLYYLYLLL